MGAVRSSGTFTLKVLAAIAGLLIILICNGCGRPSASAVSFYRARPAHAYPARLMDEHPLYEQYRRLEQEIAALRRPCTVPELSPLTVDLGELFLPGPELPEFPLQAFNAQRREWQLSLLPETLKLPSGLAPDLTARLKYAEARAREAGAERLAEAVASEERAVAEVRLQAVRERQEELNNLGLDLSVEDAEMDRVRNAERQRIWAEIEAEVAAAQASAEQRITASRVRIQQEVELALTRARSDLQEAMKKRQQIYIKSGSETKNRMSKTLAAPQMPPLGGPVPWRPEANRVSARGLQASAAPLVAADQRLRQAQAARLAAERAELGAAIFQSVSLAARRAAGLRGYTLDFPPGDPRRGRDVTEELRPQLRAMFER